jgi:hypothetical protein
MEEELTTKEKQPIITKTKTKQTNIRCSKENIQII